jgi:hypothetical protein
MTPEMILATIKAGFEFGIELLKFLQTDEGKKLVNKSLEDRTAWDKFWTDVASGLRKLFSGELLK